MRPRDDHEHGQGHERAAGFTLVELLAVLAILAVLGGLAVGAFAALPQRHAHEQAASSLKSLLRRARAAALEARAPASVAIAKGRAEARVWSLLGLWRFEDLDPATGRTTGARGAPGQGTRAVADVGRVGNAVYLEEPGAFVDLGDAPILSPVRGVRVDLWILPADAAPDGAPGRVATGAKTADLLRFRIIGKGDEYALFLREDHALVARVKGARGLFAERETAPGVAPAGRWTRVALVFDGEALAIEVDGLRRDLDPPARDPLPPALTPSEASLVLGHQDPRLGYLGGIDEVQVRGIVAEESIAIPPDLAVEGPDAIRFDARGGLDPLYHDGPAVLTIRQAIGPPRPPAKVAVELSGLVR